MPALKRRAFTLLELVVVMVMFGLVLGALYLVFIVGLRYSRRCQVYGELQQQSAVALQRLTHDLANSLADGMTTGSSPSSLCFVSSELPEPDRRLAVYDSSSGLLQFQKWLCYYLDVNQQQLIRCEVPFGSGPRTQPLGGLLVTPPTVGIMQSRPRLVVARSITLLESQPGSACCTVRVVATQFNGSQRCQVEAGSTVQLLNQDG